MKLPVAKGVLFDTKEKTLEIAMKDHAIIAGFLNDTEKGVFIRLYDGQGTEIDSCSFVLSAFVLNTVTNFFKQRT